METLQSTVDGRSLHRIRAPHDNDVLSGRGGGVNSHPGNEQFRAFAAQRREAYTLGSKEDKVALAEEVIALVKNQHPPGRFLQRDPSSSHFWIEVGPERVMAKVSQALREGAPEIRKRAMKSNQVARSGRKMIAKKRKEPSPVQDPGRPQEVYISGPFTKSQVKTIDQLRANRYAAELGDVSFSEKRVRLEHNGNYVYPTDATTPPLVAREGPDDVDSVDLSSGFPVPPPMPAPPGDMKRAHSLALSDMSYHDDDAEFVNPFADDDGKLLQPGVYRTTSLTSNGDMGGIGALLRHNDSKSSSANSVRFHKSRSLSSSMSDLPSPANSPDCSCGMDFGEGMKDIYDALHPDVDEETVPTHLYPVGFLAKGFDSRHSSDSSARLVM